VTFLLNANPMSFLLLFMELVVIYSLTGCWLVEEEIDEMVEFLIFL
jgi:hypothetical protein